MFSDEQKLREDLLKYVKMTVSINCTKCGVIENVEELDVQDAIELLIDRGWMVTNKNICCKECSPKKKR
jgi:hypothetical protein